jgi:16S rRNA (guanine527-N7)-methyltransferase
MVQTDLILQYFPNADEQKLALLDALTEGYKEWNAQINLVSRSDLENLMERHILHSLSLALFFEFQPFTEIMDLGTGGGFPGLPLAIWFPECQFTLIDSIGKKVKVVEDLAGRLNLKNVKAINTRAEKVEGPFDFVVTRAVAPAAELVKWTRGKFARHYSHELRNGLLMWKGGDLAEELKEVRQLNPKIFHLKDYIALPFFETKQIVHLPMIQPA